MRALILLCGCLCAAVISSAQSSFKSSDMTWVQVGEGEFQKFGSWGNLAQVEFESEDKAVAKIVTFNGAPQFQTVLTIGSPAAVNRFRERLRNDSSWFPVKIGGREGLVRWRFAERVKVVQQNGRKALKLQHINNGQPLEIGIIDDPKIVERLLKELAG